MRQGMRQAFSNKNKKKKLNLGTHARMHTPARNPTAEAAPLRFRSATRQPAVTWAEDTFYNYQSKKVTKSFGGSAKKSYLCTHE